MIEYVWCGVEHVAARVSTWTTGPFELVAQVVASGYERSEHA